jgi:hypothetical protein
LPIGLTQRLHERGRGGSVEVVGTGSLKFLRAFGGAFGYGFARNLRDLYTHLACVYHPGDAIYLFGFSRSAYTVRGLAGLIATCGIVPGSGCSEPDLRHAVKDVSFASRFAGVRLVMTRSRARSTTHEREGGHYLRVPQKPMAVR